MLILTRITSFMVSFPIFGTNFMPARIRFFLSVVLSVVVMLILPHLPTVPTSSLALVIMGVEQVALGIVAGFVFSIVFEVFLIAGQIIALQTGMGFASMMDPNIGQVTILSRVYWFAVLILFLSMNGHLQLIKMMIDSFTVMPLTATHMHPNTFISLIKFSQVVFSGGITIAIPTVIALLVVNFTFATMTRSSPQLNIFSIGFPITLTFGLFIVYVTFPAILMHAQNYFASGFNFLAKVIGL
jgi:flagellar biosynthetic protein FliR